MDYLKEAQELRRRAWEEVTTSPAFNAFAAADRMVSDLGGESALQGLKTIFPGRYCANHKTWHSKNLLVPSRADRKAFEKRIAEGHGVGIKRMRTSQADAAESALKQCGGPLALNDLYHLATGLGAEIGGNDPIATFRSSLSKDGRFLSFRAANSYFWWLSDREIPREWSEALGRSLNDASDQRIQEGGDR